MFAIIGGTGMTDLEGLALTESVEVSTPFGDPSAAIQLGCFAGNSVAFLSRHGREKKHYPHQVNYRANLWALKHLGADSILAVNAVGGINSDMGPGHICIPDQIIDYTHGRISTFHEDDNELIHVDFTWPYDEPLRQQLLQAAEQAGLSVSRRGVYGATQGPRLETAAEIRKYQRDGCDLVGMTGMPEAVLAREIDLPYACMALVVNWAAGLTDTEITMDDIQKVLDTGMANVRSLLSEFLKQA